MGSKKTNHKSPVTNHYSPSKEVLLARDFAHLARPQVCDEHRRTVVRRASSTGRERSQCAKLPLKGICENCEHAIPAGGLKALTLICNHRAGAQVPWQVVAPSDSCANFEQAPELVPPDIAAALADGSRLLPLSQNKFAIVDAEDYPRLSKYKWTLSKNGRTNYALTRVKVKSADGKRTRRKTLLLHRFIMNAPKGLCVDHINHNGLDNRKRNLRLCTKGQNNRNQRPHLRSLSGYKGVYFNSRRGKFVARIYMNGKQIFLGYFTDEIAAAKAYDKKAKELFGQYAYLNFPDG